MVTLKSTKDNNSHWNIKGAMINNENLYKATERNLSGVITDATELMTTITKWNN